MSNHVTDNMGGIYLFIKDLMGDRSFSYGMDADDLFQESFVRFLSYLDKNINKIREKNKTDNESYSVALFKSCVKSTYLNNIRKYKTRKKNETKASCLGGFKNEIEMFIYLDYKISSEHSSLLFSKNVRDYCKRNKVGYKSYKIAQEKLKNDYMELM